MGAGPLAPVVVAELLQAAATTIRAEMAALPVEALAWHPLPGEWCVKDVVGHLIESEKRGFAGRIRIILGADRPALEGWDQDAVARARQDCGREWADVFDEFARLRDDSVRLVAGLQPEDLPRAGMHPKVGLLTVADLLHEWVHHDRNHIRQMLANVQGWAWPHMGNAQRFSLPAPS
jgi:hypothetical protein